MSELIEKQKVLDALREIATEKFSLDDPYGVYINVLMDVEEKICRLPVVQPNGPDNLVKDSQGLAKELVNDTISRQAAIDAVHEEFDDCLVWDESGKRTADEFEIIINRLPSVQSEIIRCKDCKNWRTSDHTCREHSLVSPMMAYEYCSRAERRTNE